MLLVSLVSNNLSNYGRRHFKLFTNCHVSWDTLYKDVKDKILFYLTINRYPVAVVQDCKKRRFNKFCTDSFILYG